MPVRNWLRISDADVEEVGDAEVLAERMSAFLLFYEKVIDEKGGEDRNILSESPGMNKGSIAEALSNLNAENGLRQRTNAKL